MTARAATSSRAGSKRHARRCRGSGRGSPTDTRSSCAPISRPRTPGSPRSRDWSPRVTTGTLSARVWKRRARTSRRWSGQWPIAVRRSPRATRPRRSSAPSFRAHAPRWPLSSGRSPRTHATSSSARRWRPPRRSSRPSRSQPRAPTPRNACGRTSGQPRRGSSSWSEPWQTLRSPTGFEANSRTRGRDSPGWRTNSGPGARTRERSRVSARRSRTCAPRSRSCGALPPDSRRPTGPRKCPPESSRSSWSGLRAWWARWMRTRPGPVPRRRPQRTPQNTRRPDRRPRRSA